MTDTQGFRFPFVSLVPFLPWFVLVSFGFLWFALICFGSPLPETNCPFRLPSFAATLVSCMHGFGWCWCPKGLLVGSRAFAGVLPG